ncbi:MAG: DUF4958 family protein [Bacteroides pyogenes]|uniref:surface glycan-binding family protein n=1 Tax=Bacteroides pyogenes TaxID=310300 RepID=UPI002A90D57A|nr:surface glycan-binding family protein [Bacteroides pyogenes]MDY5354880.1 DUF4958 family protein [Bacteroides pyogenes]
MKLRQLSSSLLAFLTVILVSVAGVSCSDTETTDETGFIIYYSGMTDIGPSMSGVIGSPTYKGNAPSDFSITGITLNGETVNGEQFSIDPATGAISVSSKKDTPIGIYSLSISCVSNGKTYQFKDIVQVNMMKAVPDGITVEPNKLQAEYADVADPNSETALPTAQVKTDGNHVSIRKYEIAQNEYSDCFAISQTGEISILKGNPQLVPGIYVLALKLTTGATGEDEGIFENAVEINITSKPLELKYYPDNGKIEEETPQSGQTTFTSNAPTLKGSPEGIAYSIKSIMPATDKITIDSKSGVLSVAASHGFKAKEKFVVSVHVVNDYDKEGVDFTDVFTLEVVDFIAPITDFGYPDTECVQAVETEIKPNAGFKGDEVKFEFVEPDPKLESALTLEVDGTIRVKHGNDIPLGNYTIKVKATNPKSDPEHPAVATFTLSVKENPNFFTYFRYGNNIGLTPVEKYADQFRVEAGGKLSSVHPKPVKTDAKVKLVWSITPIHQAAGTTIDPETGEITLAGLKASQTGAVLVTATAGEGKAAVSVTQPVFFNFAQELSGILVEYTPFVIQANPKQKTVSVAPTVKGTTVTPDFVMDYRRSFNYYPIKGSHKKGQPKDKDSFLFKLWSNYFNGDESKTGSKDPLSYFTNKSDLTKPLAYVDNSNNFTIVVNPEKWTADGEYANGLLFGQIPFSTKGIKDCDDSKNPNKHFPVVIWLDTKF